MSPRERPAAILVATAARFIGAKWKPLIVANLLNGPTRFNQLLKEIPDISQKVLTDNLRALEQEGIVVRTVYAQVPPCVEYSLTDIGEQLQRVLAAMEDWAATYTSTRLGTGENCDALGDAGRRAGVSQAGTAAPNRRKDPRCR